MVIGPITQASKPIGSVAAARMPGVFAREYFWPGLSLGVPSTVDSLATAPVAVCGAVPPLTSTLLP